MTSVPCPGCGAIFSIPKFDGKIKGLCGNCQTRIYYYFTTTLENNYDTDYDVVFTGEINKKD